MGLPTHLLRWHSNLKLKRLTQFLVFGYVAYYGHMREQKHNFGFWMILAWLCRFTIPPLQLVICPLINYNRQTRDIHPMLFQIWVSVDMLLYLIYMNIMFA